MVDINVATDATTDSASLVLSAPDLFAARQEVLAVYLSEDVEQYLTRFVITSREPAGVSPDLARWIAYGASPRGSIALDECSRAHAWLHERDYVAPEDVQAVVHDVLRHRILLSYEAEADAITPDQVIDQLCAHIAVP